MQVPFGYAQGRPSTSSAAADFAQDDGSYAADFAQDDGSY
jgi:hypothetical protein